jgi:hypothetical protein
LYRVVVQENQSVQLRLLWDDTPSRILQSPAVEQYDTIENDTAPGVLKLCQSLHPKTTVPKSMVPIANPQLELSLSQVSTEELLQENMAELLQHLPDLYRDTAAFVEGAGHGFNSKIPEKSNFCEPIESLLCIVELGLLVALVEAYFFIE